MMRTDENESVDIKLERLGAEIRSNDLSDRSQSDTRVQLSSQSGKRVACTHASARSIRKQRKNEPTKIPFLTKKTRPSPPPDPEG